MQINNLFNLSVTTNAGQAQAGSVFGQLQSSSGNSPQSTSFAACLEQKVSGPEPVQQDTAADKPKGSVTTESAAKHEVRPSKEGVVSEDDSKVVSDDEETAVSSQEQADSNLALAMASEMAAVQMPAPVVDVVALNVVVAEDLSLDGVNMPEAGQTSGTMSVEAVSTSDPSPMHLKSNDVVTPQTVSAAAMSTGEVLKEVSKTDEHPNVQLDVEHADEQIAGPRKNDAQQNREALSAVSTQAVPAVKQTADKQPQAQELAGNAVSEPGVDSISSGSVNAGHAPAQEKQTETSQEQQGDLFSEELSKQLLNTEAKTTLSAASTAHPVVSEISLSETHGVDINAMTPGKQVQTAQFDHLTRQEFVSQMVDKMHMFIRDRVQQAHIELKPEFLGKVMVKMSMDGDKLSVRMEVSNPVVRELLESNFSQLRDSLMDKGFSMDSFNIMLGQQHSHGQSAPQEQGMAQAFVPEETAQSGFFTEENDLSYEMAGVPSASSGQAYSINYMA